MDVTSRLSTGDRAPDVPLIDAAGAVVRTADLWASGPVLIAFLRHFGCPFCKYMLAQLRQEHPRIAEAGATAAAVFMGSARQVARFCAERELPFPCYADPHRGAYRAYGLSTGVPRQWLVGRRVVAGSLRLLRRGVAAGLPHPGQDVRQMPGTFIVSASGRIRLAYYSRDAADNPSVDVLLAALGAA